MQVRISVSGDGLVRLRDKANRLRGIDFGPFMRQEAEKTIRVGNLTELLEGKDKFGRTMKRTKRERSTALSRRLGDGPPLIPRGTSSRAIRLAKTDSGRIGPHAWHALIYWEGFTSDDGKEILPMHAKGGGRLPVRDVIGIRPATRRILGQAVQAYAYRWWASR